MKLLHYIGLPVALLLLAGGASSLQAQEKTFPTSVFSLHAGPSWYVGRLMGIPALYRKSREGRPRRYLSGEPLQSRARRRLGPNKHALCSRADRRILLLQAGPMASVRRTGLSSL